MLTEKSRVRLVQDVTYDDATLTKCRMGFYNNAGTGPYHPHIGILELLAKCSLSGASFVPRTQMCYFYGHKTWITRPQHRNTRPGQTHCCDGAIVVYLFQTRIENSQKSV